MIEADQDIIDRARKIKLLILDCDGVGLLLKDVSDSRVADNMIRDDRPGRKDVPSLAVSGGSGNSVVNNWAVNGQK